MKTATMIEHREWLCSWIIALVTLPEVLIILLTIGFIRPNFRTRILFSDFMDNPPFTKQGKQLYAVGNGVYAESVEEYRQFREKA